MTKIIAGDSGETPDEVRAHAVERPRAQDQLYEAFPNVPVQHSIDPRDGMPSPIIPHAIKDALAPPLARETLVCLGDYSRFVIRGEQGDVLRKYSAERVEEAPDGSFRVRRSWWQRLLGLQAQRVEPVRPQCRHYAAQLVEFPQDDEHRLVLRHCLARRVDYGDFLSLNDSAMFACDMRSPPIGSNAAAIRDFDEIAIAAGQERRRQVEREDEEFDLEAALERQTAGGIFGKEKDDEE